MLFLEVKAETLREHLYQRKKYIDLIQVVVYNKRNHLRLSAQARLPKRTSRKKHSSNDWKLIAVLLGFRGDLHIKVPKPILSQFQTHPALQTQIRTNKLIDT